MVAIGDDMEAGRTPASADEGLITLEQFMAMPEEDGYRLELVRGRVVREPAPQPLHGRVQLRLAGQLARWEETGDHGSVFDNTGFLVSRDHQTVRVPDLAFVSKRRIPEQAYEEQGFWPFAPDLAVEILSPSNRASEMQEKVLEYLDAGARLVWVVDPRARRATVYRSTRDIRVLSGGEALEGGDVLPGFRLELEELFRL